MVTVQLHKLIFSARHGVLREELATGNTFEVNLDVRYDEQDRPFEGLESIVNYVNLFAIVKERMQHKLRTSTGKTLYAARKHIIEPVFGQIKSARRIRRFLLRGLEKVSGEWQLICLTHNLLKIWRRSNSVGMS